MKYSILLIANFITLFMACWPKAYTAFEGGAPHFSRSENPVKPPEIATHSFQIK
ncbi:hypothetical protein [Edaphobacter flagellatus]|uniref:hypothetical protein n=1 Tax=Edaphobacter flagellatus TaxID=1933044 RepID=UPI0021B4455C|nr:hypothetical protein [Edaphobacter flagellatus]